MLVTVFFIRAIIQKTQGVITYTLASRMEYLLHPVNFPPFLLILFIFIIQTVNQKNANR
jgi:hypothetical protein